MDNVGQVREGVKSPDFGRTSFLDGPLPEGGASLAGGSDGCEGGRPDDHVQVGVVVDYEGVVAAQLEQVLPESLQDRARHLAADLGAAGEGHQLHPGVLGHLLADVGATGAQGDDGAFRERVDQYQCIQSWRMIFPLVVHRFFIGF